MIEVSKPTNIEMLKELELRSYVRQAEDLLIQVSSQNAEIESLKEEIAILEEELTKYKQVSLSDEEFELVCRVVAAESRGEPYVGQLAVAQVIRDRYLSGFYGATISEVVLAPNQFAEPWQGNLDDYPDVRRAVETIFIHNEVVLEGQAIYFFNPETASRSAVANLRGCSEYFETIGNHEFRGWN